MLKNKLNSTPSKKEVLDLINLIGSGKFKKAEKIALTLLSQYPNSYTVLNLLGLSLSNQNQIIKGIDCYKNAIRIKPSFAEAHNNLGIAYKSLGKIKEAMECYRNAILHKSNFAEAYNNLGLIMMDENKIVESRANFETAIKFDLEFVTTIH